ASMLIAAAVGGPTTILPAVLQGTDGAGVSLTALGVIYLVAGAGPLLALGLSHVVRRRCGNRRLPITGPLALLPLLPAVPWCARSATLIAPLLVGALFVETLRRAALQNHISGLAPRQDLARYLGLRGVLVQLSLAGGSWMAAKLQAHAGFAIAC